MVIEIAKTNQVNGCNPSSQRVTAKGRSSNENSKLVMARKATITTILGSSRGKSKGAYFWDGADIAIADKSNIHYNPHRDWGVYYTDSSHDIYKTGNLLNKPVTKYYILENGKQGGSRGTYTHMFVSTVAYGGTIFWKKNPDYMRAKGEKEFP